MLPFDSFVQPKSNFCSLDVGNDVGFCDGIGTGDGVSGVGHGDEVGVGGGVGVGA